MLRIIRIIRWAAPAAFVMLAACSGSSSSDSSTDESAGALEKKDGGGATETLLRCNVFESGGGPDQEVTVKRAGEALTLVELTNHGGTEQRDLTAEEWASGVLKLRQEYPGEANTLTKEGHSWRYESKSDGWRTVGYGDCDIDKSH